MDLVESVEDSDMRVQVFLQVIDYGGGERRELRPTLFKIFSHLMKIQVFFVKLVKPCSVLGERKRQLLIFPVDFLQHHALS